MADDIEALPDGVKERARRVFLADGDAVALSPRRLLEILALLRRELPNLERVSSYANAQNLLAKSVDELRDLRAAGLQLLFLGLESGDDQTLADIHKGITVAEQIAGCRRAKEAGLTLSVTAILGLAGAERSLAHATATGDALTAIDPEFIGVLTLMLMPGTAMHESVAARPAALAGLDRHAARAARDGRPHGRQRLPVSHQSRRPTTCPSAAACRRTKRPCWPRSTAVLAAPQEAQLRPESWRLL